jgi:hypothetical protein
MDFDKKRQSSLKPSVQKVQQPAPKKKNDLEFEDDL